MPIIDSEGQMRLQIEQAAIGMVSGTLREWPHLKKALRYYGVSIDDYCPAVELQKVCQSVLDILDEMKLNDGEE